MVDSVDDLQMSGQDLFQHTTGPSGRRQYNEYQNYKVCVDDD